MAALRTLRLTAAGAFALNGSQVREAAAWAVEEIASMRAEIVRLSGLVPVFPEAVEWRKAGVEVDTRIREHWACQRTGSARGLALLVFVDAPPGPGPMAIRVGPWTAERVPE